KAHGEKKKPKDVKDIRMVEPLRLVARTYRLEYLYGGKVWNDQSSGQVPVVRQRSSIGGPPLSEEGRKSLERALEILKDSPEATPLQRGKVLLDLGDYNWVADQEKKAFENYRDAWKELSAAGGDALKPMQE